MTGDRLLGRYETQRPGPTLLIVAGLHGNEPAGALAAKSVCRKLHAAAPPLKGSLVCVAGNPEALAKRSRFLDEDLNRCWDPPAVAALRAADPAADNCEQRAQRELLELFDSLPRPAYALDLHTTSG
ncbi:MAG: succinylglutamate desuccinylase/aspartoacylase family protein, partial [Planctomycetota bacterium]|nr:succinylglutamate desuccinylase/aspartoacylase family protein [Planctomycetota bacterium]